jgi:arabinofuranosyltransferase
VFGLAPILLWELFSLVYYGSLVPNTAYAKLNLALPGAVRWLSGVLYTLDSALYDPVTLSAMLLAAAFAASRCSTWGVLASVGALLYWLYVASIGGDFMSGRFFGAPLMFALCAACLGRPMVVPSSPRLAYTCAVLAAYALAWPSSPLRGTADFGQDYQHARKIADERAFYYRVTGLLPVLKRRAQLVAAGLPVPAPRNAVEGRAFAAGSRPIAVMGDVGFFGYHAGDKPIVDVYALTDPFLARIAYAPHGDFRVGHYARPLPDGYLESRVAGDNRITDVSLHEAYAAIRLVVSGPLLSPERWRAIWQLQTGHFARAFQSDASTGADAR